VLWDLVITKPAERDLRTPARNDLVRINAAFVAMRPNPYGGDIKFLKGTTGALRRRVGSWRILFKVDQSKRVVVVWVSSGERRPLIRGQIGCRQGARKTYPHLMRLRGASQ
jgi:mRNA-degrading endonuclease RelE of RelBE toxin-antitoxin system